MATQSGSAILEDHVETWNETEKHSGPVTTASAGTNNTRPPSCVAIAVASDEDRSRLVELLGSLHVDVIAHKNLKTLRGSLVRDDVDLVITDVTLPDGNWVDVLRLTLDASSSPGILVHSRVVNDRLWSEVLWRGAYDMLIAPYSSRDGREIIKSALRAGCILSDHRPAGLRQ